MGLRILLVSASVRTEDSVSRRLATTLLENDRFKAKTESIISRDLSKNDIALVTENHVGAFYTPSSERSAQQHELLAQSDALVGELKAVNTLVVATPMYNFSAPASLKAWVDMVCRVGETFRYSESGPEGLLAIDTMYLVVATGGVPIGSPADFLVPFMKQVASFIGVKNVEVIAADATNANLDDALKKAEDKIEELAGDI
jgi:FMN-dependent NADH-azoreductase